MRSDVLNENSSQYHAHGEAAGTISADVDLSNDASNAKNKTWFIDAAGVTDITIPDPGDLNAGDYIKFVIAAAISGDLTIKTATADSDIYGHFVSAEATDNLSTSMNQDANHDKVTYDVSACTGGNGDLGDTCTFLSDGTNYYFSGSSIEDVVFVIGEQ